MIRAIVVDDEPLAREELERMIKADPGFSIVASAANGREALQSLKSSPADVIFLDIEMPLLNGLEVASRLSEWENPPFVVFATAYDKYAVEAFERNAIDYLLKPYEKNRLQKTLNKIKDFMKTQKSARESLQSLDQELIQKKMIRKLVGNKRGSRDRIVIDPSEVFYFYVEYSEIRAKLGQEELLVNATLKELSDQLKDFDFAQTHKSYIVNLNKIQKVVPMFSGNFEIILKDPAASKIPLSRRYSKAIKDRLGSW